MSHIETTPPEVRCVRELGAESSPCEKIPEPVNHAIDRVAAAVSLMADDVHGDDLQARYQYLRFELRMRYMLWGCRNDSSD